MRVDIREKLNKEWLFFDGGAGTVLQSMGLKGGELPETWNLTHKDKIIELHSGYLNAGCNIFNTNTFGANRLKYPKDLDEIVTSAINLAKEARTRCDREDAYIALDLGPTGKLLEPMGDLPFEEAVSIYKELVEIGVREGADLVLIETMNDSYEVKAAVLAAKENSDLPVFATTTYDENAKLLTGGSVASTVALLEGLGVDALGVNCSLGPDMMGDIVDQLAEYASVPVIVTPNAGLPRTVGEETHYDVDAETFSDLMVDLAKKGVQMMGGCCGTTPEHIKQTIAKVGALPFVPNTYKNRTFTTSFSTAVEIGKVPVIIGERINPTGKKKFKQALRDSDMEYIMTEGLNQESNGAHVLDVNVGLPEIDEPAMMVKVVTELQGVTGLPIQIDTSDAKALEKAMRVYNGKPMVNSVNGNAESIENVMPIVAKYGGVLVGLTLDEGGIPDTAEGRIAIAKKIYEAADRYGIPRKDIVIDALAMTISSDDSSAVTTLKTLERIRDEFDGHTILGVSNISFGLPRREIVNSEFFLLAMYCGLSCGIINPGNEDMMRAYRAFKALSGMDENCTEFIEKYAGTVAPGAAPQGAAKDGQSGTGADGDSLGKENGGKNAKSPGDFTLAESIEKGLIESAKQKTAEALKTKPAMEIVDGELIPALDKVGKGFEKGTLFLPQLLKSADAAKAAFNVIKESMSESEEKKESKGRIVIATVKGDIHDIGKNIVKVMLENYGYDMIDLGKDVAPELIVETAIEEDIDLVALSALMTTTVVSMDDTIKLLREKKPGTKVVVGGAVMTQEYADAIDADCYAKDAMATVRYADFVFGNTQE